MPTGPKGQKRPAHVIGNAIKVARNRHWRGRGRVHRSPAEERGGGRARAQERGRTGREDGPGATGGEFAEGCRTSLGKNIESA
jgi:hypothetical protein